MTEKKMNAWSEKSWQFDHIGHAVLDLDAATRFYCETMGFFLEEREIIDSQRVSVAFIRSPGGLFELLAPLPGNTNLEKFLQKRGPGLHHLAFQVPSLADEIERLKLSGVKLIDESPRPGSRNMDIAFLHPASCQGMLVELCSRRKS